jgi:hypothetical protein
LNDFDLLPIDLRERSLSKNEIVLNYFDVFKAIEILRSNNWSILGWEAWISFVDRSSSFCIKTIDLEKQDWDNRISKEFPDCEIYFCITVTEK